MSSLLKMVVVVLAVAASARLAAAQTTGAVQGTVTDEQGALLARATVQILHTATNAAKSTQTGATGGFVFDFVQPGTYAVTVDRKSVV